MAVENNEVRILGIRPAHNTDDFPVSQADKDLLKMTIHLMAYHQPTTAWKKVLCDLNGKLIVDPTAILENPPVEDNAGKAATSEWCYDHWKLANAHHAKYTDGEAQTVADARILIHKNIATAHQDTPQLILDHKGDAAAHHAYVEGSWVTGLAFGGVSVGITYSIQSGYYTRIGNIVTLSGYIALTSKGISTGVASITGLPFAVVNHISAYVPPILRLDHITFANQYQGYTAVGSTTIVLEEITEAGVRSELTDTNFANNSRIIVGCTYRV